MFVNSSRCWKSLRCECEKWYVTKLNCDMTTILIFVLFLLALCVCVSVVFFSVHLFIFQLLFYFILLKFRRHMWSVARQTSSCTQISIRFYCTMIRMHSVHIRLLISHEFCLLLSCQVSSLAPALSSVTCTHKNSVPLLSSTFFFPR